MPSTPPPPPHATGDLPNLAIPAHPDVAIDGAQRVWDRRTKLDIVRFRHRRFDGTMSDTRTWEVWRRGRAAAIVPYDPVRDAVVLIEQFRLPALVAGYDPVLVELPAGMCDGGEPPEITAAREIEEEMHLSATDLTPIGTFILTAGGADETCAIYVGRVAVPPAGPDGLVATTGGLAAEHEDIRVRVWDAAAAEAAALAGRIPNSVAALGLMWLAANRPRLRRDWTETDR